MKNYNLKIHIFNHSHRKTVDFNFIKKYLKKIQKELTKNGVLLKAESLTIAFVSLERMRQLNKTFRSKNKPTDILSFSDAVQEELDLVGYSKNGTHGALKKALLKTAKTDKSLGELVLCPAYIRKKAQKRRVSVREETAYVVLHGVLHLLGFEHEKSQKEARKMYSLQDRVFEKVFYS